MEVREAAVPARGILKHISVLLCMFLWQHFGRFHSAPRILGPACWYLICSASFVANHNSTTSANILSLQMFSNLVSHCFDSCVDDFTTKSLVQRESGCVTRCVQKFMAGSERIGLRFSEQQTEMMQKQSLNN